MVPQEARVKVRVHVSEAYSKHKHSWWLSALPCVCSRKPNQGVFIPPLNEMLIYYRVYSGIRLECHCHAFYILNLHL